MKEIVLDVETTGLDPIEGHRIIEIGCVELIDKIKTGNIYHKYINPERDVPEEAYKIHGISNDKLINKPIFKDIANDFLEFIKDANLVIHNASFDMKFINYELRKINLEIIERRWVIDSLQIARNKFPGLSNSLDALCKRFKIDISRREKHGALLDAELLSDVYLELSGGSQRTIFSEEKNNDEQYVFLVKDRKILKSRCFKLTKQELNCHKKFILDNFKSNLWNYN